MKTTGSSVLAPKAFKADDDEVVGDGNDRANRTVVNLCKNKKIPNFYRHFIRGFSRIAALLTSLLKTTRLSESAPKAFRADDNEVIGGSDDRADETVMDSSKSKKREI